MIVLSITFVFTEEAADSSVGGAGSFNDGSPQSVNAHADRWLAPPSFTVSSRLSLSWPYARRKFLAHAIRRRASGRRRARHRGIRGRRPFRWPIMLDEPTTAIAPRSNSGPVLSSVSARQLCRNMNDGRSGSVPAQSPNP